MTSRNAALCLAALLVAAFPAAGPAKTIVIDGDFSDWTGDSSGIPLHGNAWDDGEWIYKGEAGDARTDTEIAAQSTENDIVEFRITTDGTWLYLYFETNIMGFLGENDVLVAVSIDTDKDGGDSNGMGWIGPDSDTNLPSAGEHAERNIAIHNVTGESDTQIELHADDGTSWYEPPTPGWKAWIDGAEDKLEAAIALDDLGIDLGDDTIVRVAAISLGNTGNWCNPVIPNPPNASTQIGDIDVSDAIDVVGGVVGASANAWDRDLSDDFVDYFHDIDLSVHVPDWSRYAD